PEAKLVLNDQNEVENYVLQFHPELFSSNSDLQLITIKKSPQNTYYTFRQHYKEILVANSIIKVAVNNSGEIQFITGNYFNTKDWNLPLEKTQKMELPVTIKNVYKISEDISSTQHIIVDENNDPKRYFEFELIKNSDRSRITLLLNENGELISENDNRVYFTAIDTTVTGKVFGPDPLTSAETTYVGEYKDFDDADTAVLTAELLDVSFKAKFEDGIFYLRTDSVIIKDLNTPITGVVTSITPEFNFTRSESGFEDVNTFYHITNLNNYILSLGYTDLQNFYIEIDPHGASGADQSFYVSAAIPSIQLGEGGVDDAEDADVIVHEYGHALSDQAAPETNDGLERRALDEGYGDYFAASYSRMFSDYRWNFIFSWDGHNEFWAGRNANTNKHYPEDNSADYYSSSEIWSGALMDIFDAIGKENTDKIVLETLYGSFDNMSMPDAAQIILASEESIFGGLYYEEVYNALDARGLMTVVATENLNSNQTIQFKNTYGFSFNNEPLMIELPEYQNYTLNVYGIDGRMVYSENGRDKIIEFSPGKFALGMFVVEVITDGEVGSVLIESTSH
ncbi:MAG: hypothetical protein KBF42_06550, partial [Chitinophagales bacterium]|nr:hypothetical protein [Chitinophagales bacterium]MBP9221024.1 hypothetical protein [Chitinophagales bacterium]